MVIVINCIYIHLTPFLQTDSFVKVYFIKTIMQLNNSNTYYCIFSVYYTALSFNCSYFGLLIFWHKIIDMLYICINDLHRAITMSTAPSLCRQRHHFRYFGPKSHLVTAPCIKIVHLLTRTTYAPIHMRKCPQPRFGKQKQHVYTIFCVFVPCAIWEKTCHKHS